MFQSFLFSPHSQKVLVVRPSWRLPGCFQQVEWSASSKQPKDWYWRVEVETGIPNRRQATQERKTRFYSNGKLYSTIGYVLQSLQILNALQNRIHTWNIFKKHTTTSRSLPQSCIVVTRDIWLWKGCPQQSRTDFTRWKWETGCRDLALRNELVMLDPRGLTSSVFLAKTIFSAFTWASLISW